MSMQTIDDLVMDLAPVRPVRPAQIWALAFITTGLAILAVALFAGLRPDVAGGRPAGLVLLRSGMLLLLGMAALAALAAAARPGVGQASTGWRWALGAAALFPAATVILSLLDRAWPMAVLNASSGPWCLGISGASGLMIGTAITLWLRRGAPVALDRAGWLVGLCAGSFGTLAYSLHCPSETVQYIGIWYTAAIGLCAVAARLVVPRLLRW